jgi:ribosomal protein S18 acetylase RimI-like enzyme
LKKIYLEVSKNNFEGISFYTKMKFIVMHTRKNYFFINNKHIDALTMVKAF